MNPGDLALHNEKYNNGAFYYPDRSEHLNGESEQSMTVDFFPRNYFYNMKKIVR